jgi:ATP-binding cassette subfamily F protein 3
MIILSANNIAKSFGVENLFSGITFHVNKGDRIGLIGVNGAGKTTLLNILAGELAYDSGDFFVAANTQVGYLKQSDTLNSSKTVYEEMLGIFADVISIENALSHLSMDISERSGAGQDVEKLLHDYDDLMETYKARNGYGYKSEIAGILNSLAFPPECYNQSIAVLSGGEKTRLALAALLLKKPELLLLDEPTNHLDIDTLKWLEQYLKNYAGTIVLISHDRYFLDQTVSRIFEIENHLLYAYEGNYTAFAQKKKDRETAEFRQYEKQQKEISRQEEIIRRFKQHGTEKLAKRAQSREKRLEHIDVMNRPSHNQGKIRFNFKEGPQSGRDVLSAHEISQSFGRGEQLRLLFKNVFLDVKRGERICLVGPNGIGKTTLLKIILSAMEPSTGYVKVGHNIVFGYYDQGQELLNDTNTVLNEMHSEYRLYTETEIRSLLGRFLFRSDEVFKPVAALSGGEKARLSLLKLMISGSNFLVMDEPTNHLDIASKEIFEDALIDFPGTLLLVSHDRYFLNKVPTRIIELSEAGVTNYLGGYDYYMEKKFDDSFPKGYLGELQKNRTAGTKAGENPDNDTAAVPTDKALRMAERRLEKEALTLAKKREKALKQMEATIMTLEARIQEIHDELCSEAAFSDHHRTLALTEELADKKTQLEAIYQAWLEAH